VVDDLGDPYTPTGADIDGRVAIDWGVYGVPETYVVDARAASPISRSPDHAASPRRHDPPLIARVRQ